MKPRIPVDCEKRFGSRKTLDGIRRPRTALVILAVGLLGEITLLYVFGHLGRDLTAEAYGPRTADNHHTAAMVAMMVLAFIITIAFSAWLLAYLRSYAVLWHWGQLGLVAVASFGVAWLSWMHISDIARNGMDSQGPFDFMLEGMVAALLIGSIAVPFGLAWRWFGSRA